MQFDRREEESKRRETDWTDVVGMEEEEMMEVREISFSSFDWLWIRLVTATVSFVHFLVFLLLV